MVPRFCSSGVDSFPEAELCFASLALKAGANPNLQLQVCLHSCCFLRCGVQMSSAVVASMTPELTEFLVDKDVSEGVSSPMTRQMEDLFGRGLWRPVPRFSITQRDGSARVIDNGRACGQNRPTSTSERIHTRSTGASNAVVRAFASLGFCRAHRYEKCFPAGPSSQRSMVLRSDGLLTPRASASPGPRRLDCSDAFWTLTTFALSLWRSPENGLRWVFWTSMMMFIIRAPGVLSVSRRYVANAL